MTRLEFNKKQRPLMKRIMSSGNSPIRFTKSDRNILLYSFYFALRYEDRNKWVEQEMDKIKDAEQCFDS